MGLQAGRSRCPSAVPAWRCGSFLLLGLLLSTGCRIHSSAQTYPDRLVDSIDIGHGLIDAQVLPNGKFVYAMSEDAGVLSVVRTSDLQLVAQIGGLSCCGGQVACSPDGRYIYATNYTDNDWVAVVRTADHVVIDSLMVDGEVNGVAVSPDGKRLYMAVDADFTFIVVARLPDNVIEDTVFVPRANGLITALRVSPNGAHLFVGTTDESEILSVSLPDLGLEWRVDSDLPWSGGIVVNPSGSPIYAAENSHVSARESGTGAVIDSIAFSPYVRSVDVARDGSFICVAYDAEEDKGTVAVVRTSDDSVVCVIALPDAVYDAAPSPDGQKLYVAGGNGKLYVLGR